MSLTELTAISPVDGRYRDIAEPLEPFASERALIKNRVMIEVEYLCKLERYGVVNFSPEEKIVLRQFYENLSEEDAKLIKDIETKGVEGINVGKDKKGKGTDHDMKAIELFMKKRLEGSSLQDRLEMIHFCLTSEDVNNLAYTLLLKEGVRKVVVPSLVKLEEMLVYMAEQYKDMPMPGRTHGQHAIPTTVGKELAVFAYGIAGQLDDLINMRLKGKLNGAIGNYSAFYATHPQINWAEFSREFVESFGLVHNPITTQIEPHDSMVDLFDKLKHINTIILGTDQDMWQYISDEYFVQKPEEGEVGSSTMPQKINPIKFENSEANLGAANALLAYFANKLPVSRFQRDLSDSATQRWIGTALAASVVAYTNTVRGLRRSMPYKEKLDEELNNHWEVLGEPVQQILRREGVSGAYNILKGLTQGKKWSQGALVLFAKSSGLPESVQQEIITLTPQKYIGKGPELASEAVGYVKETIARAKKYAA